MKLQRGCESSGLTLVEVLVMIATVGLVAAMLISAVGRAKARAKRIGCVNNLKQIGLAVRQWSIDHGDRLPWQTSTNKDGTPGYFTKGEVFRYFQVASNVWNDPRALICPADVRVPADDFGAGFSNTNISYFVGLDFSDTTGAMFLLGDRNITNGPLPSNRIMELTPNRPAGWTHELHNRQGNVLLSDNSVQGWSNLALRQIGSDGVTNRLAIP